VWNGAIKIAFGVCMTEYVTFKSLSDIGVGILATLYVNTKASARKRSV